MRYEEMTKIMDEMNIIYIERWEAHENIVLVFDYTGKELRFTYGLTEKGNGRFYTALDKDIQIMSNLVDVSDLRCWITYKDEAVIYSVETLPDRHLAQYNFDNESGKLLTIV